MTSDKLRSGEQQVNVEKVIKRETIKLFVSGILLIGLGTISIALAYAESFYQVKAPVWINLISLGIVLLTIGLLFSRPFVKKFIRSKQDEYEQRINISAKAKAYDFIAPWVVISVLLFNVGAGVNGLLALVFGISLIKIARGGGHLDV
ncbi:hypothetical protein EOM57_02915 [Candidatus Saccharibacteria bacterium]|nr:hypothetical protein [Candidatus Saccharibacteria bacterium]